MSGICGGAGSHVRTRLHIPVTRVFTGNFVQNRPFCRFPREAAQENTSLRRKFPKNGTGNFSTPNRDVHVKNRPPCRQKQPHLDGGERRAPMPGEAAVSGMMIVPPGLRAARSSKVSARGAPGWLGIRAMYFSTAARWLEAKIVLAWACVTAIPRCAAVCSTVSASVKNPDS